MVTLFSCSIKKLTKINELLENKSSVDFIQFVENMSRKDDTWCLWSQFIFQDGLAYIGFFLAIRSGDWDFEDGLSEVDGSSFFQRLIISHTRG